MPRADDAIAESELEPARCEHHGARRNVEREERDEHRRADECGDDARRHLGRECRAARRIDREHEARAEHAARAAARARTRRPRASRAACGTRSPTQPMVPASATADAVTSVARRSPRAAGASASRRGCAPRPRRARARRCASAGATAQRRREPIGTRAAGRSRGSTPVKLPSSQKVMAGSWLYGSARYLTRAIARAEERADDDAGEHEREDRVAPARSSVPMASHQQHGGDAAGERERLHHASAGSEEQMPATAPSAQPADTPRMSGETSGFLKRLWYAAPAAASAAPTASAAATRGARTCSTTASTFARETARHAGEPRTTAPARRPRHRRGNAHGEAPRGEDHESPDGRAARAERETVRGRRARGSWRASASAPASIDVMTRPASGSRVSGERGHARGERRRAQRAQRAARTRATRAYRLRTRGNSARGTPGRSPGRSALPPLARRIPRRPGVPR